MADINWVTLSFEILLGAVAVLLFLTYLLFVKMNDDVRRARLYIMADRIKRFLFAFFIGFLSLTVVLLVSFAGVLMPTWVTSSVVFFWLGATVYGCLELLFIAAPFQLRRSRAVGATDGGRLARWGGSDRTLRPPKGR